MDKKEKKQMQQEAYNEYVKQVTPTHNLAANMAKAFLVGGVICVIGQFILNICRNYGLDKDTSGVLMFAAPYAALYAVCLYFFAMDESEKELVGAVIRKMKRRYAALAESGDASLPDSRCGDASQWVTIGALPQAPLRDLSLRLPSPLCGGF